MRAGFFGVLAGLVLLLVTGCVTPDIGGPVAPRDSEGAGILTLPNGRSLPVLPAELAYSGDALYRWPDGHVYEGAMVAGKPHGMGAETLPDGETYRGLWQQGSRHGHGELSRADGSRYVGDFVAGLREGSGVEQSGEGLYRGSWLADVPDGMGEFHTANGSSYKGQWQGGVRQGRGVFINPGGNTYEGDWYQDAPDGFGIMTNASGSVYEGQWQASQQQGYGRMTNEAGVTYEGTWVAGKRHGFGSAERPDGSSYRGEWVAGQRQGQGRESFADGSFHEGAWEVDQPLGPGTRKDRTGIVISGMWNDDQLSSGLLRLPTGAEYAGRILKQKNKVVDEKLLHWLERTAATGDPYAHYFLGTVYQDFQSPAPDAAMAQTHFRRAAEAGVPDGQFRLALLIVDENPSRAIEWLATAAADDHAQANTLLGQYYLTGEWVPFNLATAVRYLSSAAAAGDMSARNNLAWVLATTSDDEIRDADQALALVRPLALLYGQWQQLDTFAAALAAAGDFEQAVSTQRQAISEATREGREEVVAGMQARLTLYQQQQPYREPDPAPGSP